jgi:hypothetical protein
MLLGVAARRLGVPVFLAAMFGQRAARKRGEADQRAALAFAEARAKQRAERASTTNEALLAKKRTGRDHRGPAAAPNMNAGILGAAPPPPNAQRPIGTPRGQPNAPRVVAPRAPQVSTAERLAQKRREKK